MIRLDIVGNKMTIKEFTIPVKGSVNYDKVQFIVNSDWAGLTQQAQFINGEVIKDVLLIDTDTISIPPEVLAIGGKISLVLIGLLTDEQRIITNNVTLTPNDSGAVVEAESITPTVAEQLTNIAMQAKEDAAQAMADAAQTAPLRDETLGYRNEAEGFKDQAEGAKDRAVLAEGNAEGFADDAEEQAIEALNNKLNGIEAHDISVASHPSIIQDIRNVEAIARGRATAHVFDTKTDMDAWLLVPDNIEKLVVGDNLYIRDVGVKDYWWDGESAQELEAEAPDLTDYYLKSQVDAMMPITITRTEYDALVASGTVEAGRVYDIYEE